MSNETSKSLMRRLHDIRYATRYFRGSGIDIGSGSDSLARYCELFPRVSSIRSWDLQDGDAEFMHSVEDSSYDFVHSSHCLEHLRDPLRGFENWIRICRVGGHLVITVPDEDLYEQGTWPSRFNSDHRWTFTINKAKSWSYNSLNIFDLLFSQRDCIQVLKVELLDSSYLYNLGSVQDQTRDIAESAIEIVVKKIK